MMTNLGILALGQMKGKSEYLDDDGVFDGVKAYGAVLGTLLVCSWVEVVLSFIRPTVIWGRVRLPCAA